MMKEQVLDFDITENIDLLLKKDIILYGTASKAERLYPLIEKAGLNVVGCLDGSEKKIGGFFHNLPIERFADISDRICLDKVIILICSTFVEEIIADCNKVCNEGLHFVTPFGFQLAFVLNRNNPKLEPEFRKWYNEQYDMWYYMQKDSYLGWLRYTYTKKLIDFMQSDVILVYQAGKVGSAGISHSLDKAGIGNIHIHYFNPEKNGFLPPASKEYSDKIQRIIKSKDNIKIITLVRDPVARDISAVFQSIIDPSKDFYRNLSWNLTEGVIQIMSEDFNPSDQEKPKDKNLGKAGLFSWFDMEMKEIFGIDIYSYPFDKEKGYSIIKQDNVECLVIKLERLDLCADEIIDFIGGKDFSLLRDNVGSSKPYGYLYDKCKKELSLPQELIDHYYDGEAIRHFYTEEEIASFRSKWENKRKL